MQATTQHFVFVHFEADGEQARALPVHVPFHARDVAAVWTLPHHTNPNAPPPQPFTPTHGRNAFLEDYIHDWTMQGRRFLYRSRVADRGVWVLIETRTQAPDP